MANKKVSQLVSKPSVLVTDLFPIADPTTGQLFKTTISDLGTAIGSGVSSVNTLVGAVVLDTDDIQELASPTNRWFTDTRARAALSASSPLAYNSGTGVFSIPAATSSQDGYLTSADWTTFNAKQAALSGTGFVKISGTTISYDNSTYLTTSAAASTYLALAGGTLTGALNGTSATFTGDLTLSSTNPRLYFTDTDNNPDYFISNTDGTFTIYDVTNSTSRFTIGTTGNGTFGGNLTVGQIIRSGGTSTEFLKADGSVDSTSYLTTASAASTYLPLAGGTLTGAVSGTRLTLSQNSADITLSIGNAGTGRAFSVLGTSYFSTDIQLGYATNAILKTTALGFITSAIAGTDYQAPLSGTGFVKISGSTISYDNSTYALDSAVVKLTGAQTVAGVKTMSNVFKLDDTLQIKNIAQLSNSTGYTGIWAETAAIGFYTGANAIRLLYAGNYNYTMPASDGTLALTSQLSAYLPLAGGTLTGALNGTSALFSGAVRANNPSEGATGEGLIAGQSFKIDGTGTSQKAVMYMVSNVLSDTYASGLTAQYANFAGDKAFGFNLNTSGGFELYVKNTTFNKAITVANSGAVTLTSALSGTSATFSGSVIVGTTALLNFGPTSSFVGMSGNNSTGALQLYANNTQVLGFAASTGAATFSSSVTATQAYFTNSSGDTVTLSKGSGPSIQFAKTDATAQAWALAGEGTAFKLYNYTAGTTPFLVTTTGNVGIGTTAPTRSLQITRTSTAFINAEGTVVSIGSSDTELRLFGNNTETMTLKSGNVGIGTTSPVAYGGYIALTIGNNAANSVGLLKFRSTYNSGDGAEIYQQTSGDLVFNINGTTNAARITSGGNVLIGTTSNLESTASKLSIAFDNNTIYGIALKSTASGSSAMIRFINDSGTLQGSITSTGVGAVLYNTTSDYRLKEDLKEIKGLDIVNKIKVYDYKWKLNDSRMDGVLAHELQEILPYAVTGVKDGEEMQSVDYSKIVPVMVQAIKELKAELDTLKNK